MEFFLQYPDYNGPDGDMLGAGSVADLARAAERLGFHGFSLSEHPAPGARWLSQGGHQTLDPFVGLAGAATVTERIRLLSFLSVLPYRNPLILAKAAATLDRLSNGRFVLGAGAGYLKGEFHAVGSDFASRNAQLDEALEVLPLHWSGEPFDFEGRDLQRAPDPGAAQADPAADSHLAGRQRRGHAPAGGRPLPGLDAAAGARRAAGHLAHALPRIAPGRGPQDRRDRAAGRRRRGAASASSSWRPISTAPSTSRASTPSSTARPSASSRKRASRPSSSRRCGERRRRPRTGPPRSRICSSGAH